MEFKSLKYSESASPKDHFCEVSLKSVGSGELINMETLHQEWSSSDVTHSKSGRHTIDSQLVTPRAGPILTPGAPYEQTW